MAKFGDSPDNFPKSDRLLREHSWISLRTTKHGAWEDNGLNHFQSRMNSYKIAPKLGQSDGRNRKTRKKE